MKHVFVETNWVVDWAAPAHHQNPAAVALLEKATKGAHRLYLPAICLTEARPPILERFAARPKSLRSFLKWQTDQPDHLASTDIEAARRVLDRYESTINAAQRGLQARLETLHQTPGIEVYPLDDAMLARAVALTTLNLQLKPFDQAILAAILVRAERLRANNEYELALCELDTDLQPWSKSGTKEPLTSLYDEAGIWVFEDFELRTPPPDSAWIEQRQRRR